ncbi:mannonate dehydratase [Ahrensia kielensis]|uniref:mannonate dehydratase n=1 Tax=Ahrensia kielensis TaxID=76980 RepID=UPI00035DA213|nr:mannonate dehydratase [Ahrensia kielensis]
MKQTWRWFGEHDNVAIDEIEQAGASGIVTALHHIDNGEVWSSSEIEKRQQLVATRKNGKPSSLKWDVVESLPVSEDIKKQDNDWRRHIDNYKLSLENLAAAGLETICYNFMPILDWTRTDLSWPLPNGARCMRFDYTDFAVFDIHILARSGATENYDDAIIESAAQRFAAMDDASKIQLTNNLVAGLPGANQKLTLNDLQLLLDGYHGIDENRFRKNHYAFLEEVIPTAERLGMRLCCHPDDPPFSLLGLPRTMSTELDYRLLMEAVDSPANGITLCSGSLGANKDNDLPGMMERLGDRVHFLHLRNVVLDVQQTPGSFYEGEHLSGNTDMVALIDAVLNEENRRKKAGRKDWNIPFRPDHGQDILDDLNRSAQPGYPAIGRLKGLAELRGVISALEAVKSGKLTVSQS